MSQAQGFQAGVFVNTFANPFESDYRFHPAMPTHPVSAVADAGTVFGAGRAHHFEGDIAMPIRIPERFRGLLFARRRPAC